MKAFFDLLIALVAVPSTKVNLNINEGAAWYNLYGVTSGIADIDFLLPGGNSKIYPTGYYTGSGAITLSNYNNMPIGTVILDFQAFKTHYKTGATTWKSSAAAS